MKSTNVIQWVITPTRQRLAADRKRTLRSRRPKRFGRTAMAARSVWSEPQSRVIESRNFDDCWCLRDRVRGDSTEVHTVRPTGQPRQARCTADRPGSKSGAKRYGDNLGTWESLHFPGEETREGTRPSKTSPGVYRCGCLVGSLRSTVNARGPRTSRRQGSGYRVAGSLSSLIIAIESREISPGGSL